MATHIALPDERLEQLRMLAKSQGVSVADAVGLLIRDAIAAGKLSPSLPGISVKRIKDSVEVDFGSFKRVMNLELARAFASGLRWLARPKLHEMHDATASLAEAVGGFSSVGLSRRGTSIKISKDSNERTLAPSVAIDLAGLIDEAAAPKPL